MRTMLWKWRRFVVSCRDQREVETWQERRLAARKEILRSMLEGR